MMVPRQKDAVRMHEPDRGNICAIVVTYDPDVGVALRLQGIAGQVAGLVVVDNSADDAVAGALRSVTDRLGAHLVVNAENLGIAAALNLGVRWAVAQGYRWVLTLDQDSAPLPSLVAGLVTAFHASDLGDRLGAVGANYVDASTSTPTHRTSWFRGRTWRECPTVITAGTLLSLRAFATVGPFRDAFFIDSVDHDYCLRLRALGSRVIVTRDALLVHSVGDYERVRVLGMEIAHSIHPPARRYYITRNRLVLIGEYALKEPRWALGQIRRLIQDTLLMLLFERARRRKVVAMGLGAWHFLRRRLGRLDARGLRLIDA